jgi:hypothetical protein
MNNSDMPAMAVTIKPSIDDTNHAIIHHTVAQDVQYTGLTKREHFAGVIIQGLLAGGVYSEVSHCIEECMEYTDALLKALEVSYE